MNTKCILKYLTVLIASAAMLFSIAPITGHAQGTAQPNYGIANVDGIQGEWNLAADFFADMHQASRADKPVLSKLYLRYDCLNNVMYALVLAEGDLEIVADTDPSTVGAFIKVYDGTKNTVVVSDNSGDDGTPPDFAWVVLNGSQAKGWEASFPWDSKYQSIFVHTNIWYSGASATSALIDNIPLQVICTDWGDLPSSYGITSGSSGAHHTIGWLHLGGTIDGENDGQASDIAAGDDLAGKNDEDGIIKTASEDWKAGQTVHLDVTVTGGTGYLYGWFDWNDTKSFEEDERAAFGALGSGTHHIALVVPVDPPDSLFTRFRLYANDPGSSPLPTGEATDGEVEDYMWGFGPTAVHLISLTASSSGFSFVWALGGLLAMAFLIYVKRMAR